jgi:hypothetical protein
LSNDLWGLQLLMKDPKNKGKDMDNVKKLIIAMSSFQDFLEYEEFNRDYLTSKELEQLDEYSNLTFNMIQSFKENIPIDEVDIDVFLSQNDPTMGIDVDAFMQRGRDYEKQIEEKAPIVEVSKKRKMDETSQPLLGQFERAIKPRQVSIFDDIKEREGREEKEPTKLRFSAIKKLDLSKFIKPRIQQEEEEEEEEEEGDDQSMVQFKKLVERRQSDRLKLKLKRKQHKKQLKLSNLFDLSKFINPIIQQEEVVEVEKEPPQLSIPIKPQKNKDNPRIISIKVKRGEIKYKIDMIKKEIENGNIAVGLFKEQLRDPFASQQEKKDYKKEIIIYEKGDKKLKITGIDELNRQLKFLTKDFEKLGDEYKKLKESPSLSASNVDLKDIQEQLKERRERKGQPVKVTELINVKEKELSQLDPSKQNEYIKLYKERNKILQFDLDDETDRLDEEINDFIERHGKDVNVTDMDDIRKKYPKKIMELDDFGKEQIDRILSIQLKRNNFNNSIEGINNNADIDNALLPTYIYLVNNYGLQVNNIILKQIKNEPFLHKLFKEKILDWMTASMDLSLIYDFKAKIQKEVEPTKYGRQTRKSEASYEQVSTMAQVRNLKKIDKISKDINVLLDTPDPDPSKISALKKEWNNVFSGKIDKRNIWRIMGLDKDSAKGSKMTEFFDKYLKKDFNREHSFFIIKPQNESKDPEENVDIAIKTIKKEYRKNDANISKDEIMRILKYLLASYTDDGDQAEMQVVSQRIDQLKQVGKNIFKLARGQKRISSTDIIEHLKSKKKPSTKQTKQLKVDIMTILKS